MKKFKLVIVTTVPDTFNSILKDLPVWLNNSYEVLLVCGYGKGSHRYVKDDRIKVIYVPMERGISPIKDAVSIIRFWFLVKEWKPHVVHSYTPKAGLVAMVGSLLGNVKNRIHTFTGLLFPTSFGFKRKILIAVDKLICWCATVVVAEGKGVADDLRINQISTKKIMIIGYGNIVGVDLNHYRPTNTVRKVGISNDIVVFAFIGRLSKDKGLAELIDSFVSLPTNTQLLIAGSLDDREPISEYYQKIITTHHRISFLGYVEDIRSVFEACDIVVQPSYREGFPNVLLQAGAMSKPVIATDVNGSREIITDNVNGVLVAPRNTDALREAMSKATYMSREELARMGEAARENVAQKYEQSSYREKLADFYEDVLRETNF
tara:strand:- start:2808 stop:3938 length:1131 start_codon:yes stop_codon:yes gene_type:complete